MRSGRVAGHSALTALAAFGAGFFFPLPLGLFLVFFFIGISKRLLRLHRLPGLRALKLGTQPADFSVAQPKEAHATMLTCEAPSCARHTGRLQGEPTRATQRGCSGSIFSSTRA